ncbi:cytochrome c, class I [hydrothermal vent metagenome]|uniref:Cytochrome c, class I n=1 Tax=hydrothermal vent metagenome TaxID=652676 RepID=A0A1W1BUK9_9ZZZZ
MRYFFVFLLLLSITLYAQNNKAYQKGANLYFANGCANCHGTNAEGSSYYPKLANKKQKRLIKKLQNFKNGIADTQKQEIMFTFAQALKNNEIKDITYFLSHFQKANANRYEIEEDLLGVDY